MLASHQARPVEQGAGPLWQVRYLPHVVYHWNALRMQYCALVACRNRTCNISREQPFGVCRSLSTMSTLLVPTGVLIG